MDADCEVPTEDIEDAVVVAVDVIDEEREANDTEDVIEEDIVVDVTKEDVEEDDKDGGAASDAIRGRILGSTSSSTAVK